MPQPCLGFIVALSLGLSACSGHVANKNLRNPRPLSAESGLAFQNVTLKQTNAQGQLLWQLKAREATYRDQQKVVQVKDMTGELLQNGKPAFKIVADRAHVEQKGQRVILKGKITTTDVFTQTVFQGQEVEWRSQEQLLEVRKDLRLHHPQLQMWASAIRASSRTHQVKAWGNVIGQIRQPELRLKTEHLVWHTRQQQISLGTRTKPTSSSSVTVEQIRGKTVGDRAQAGEAEIDLRRHTVVLSSGVAMQLHQPPLNLNSQSLVWNYKQQELSSDRPLKLQHRDHKIQVIANQGYVNQPQARVQLTGAVQVKDQQGQFQLKTQQLIWSIPQQQIEAIGQVSYQQKNAQFELTGGRAIGKIQAQTVQISGGEVVTEIFP